MNPKETIAPKNNQTAELDDFMNISGELSIIRARFAQAVASAGTEVHVLKDIGRGINGARSQNDELRNEIDALFRRDKTLESRCGKKMLKQLEETSELLNELAARLNRSEIVPLINSFDAMTGVLGKVSGDIQAWGMRSRMVDAAAVLAKLEQAGFAAGAEIDRKVKVAVTETAAELDKKTTDALLAAMTEIVFAEARLSLAEHGGTITVSAERRDNSVWITLTGDGDGPNPDAVARAAAAKGLVAAQKLPQLNAREKLAFLMEKGFPAENFKGADRLQSAKAAVSAIGATMDIVSGENDAQGSFAITLKIPVSLAIIKALLARIGTEVFAFPLGSVREIVKVAANEIYSIDGNDAIKLREHALSLVDFSKIMGIASAEKPKAQGKTIVVITDGVKSFGVEVDDLIGEEEVVIKSLPEHFARIKGLLGASILGDGAIALIADTAAVIAISKK